MISPSDGASTGLERQLGDAQLSRTGATVGVEEEYHLVDPETTALLNSPQLSARALAGSAGPRLQPDMLTSQLEAATEVCTDLEHLRRAIVGMRRDAAAAAAKEGAAILATSTHPFASLSEIRVTPRARYGRLVERFGTIVTQFNLCGCHVHVSVPDLETAVLIMSAARPYLPVLAAITGSSPFQQGVDTHFDSSRLPWLALWPQGGPPPHLASAQDYLAIVAQSVAIDMIDDASAMLWDIRPSLRYPTLEFRAADVCTDTDDAVLYAAMVRSLARILAVRIGADVPSVPISDQTLRAARWRAARYGLSDSLWSPRRSRMVPASVALADFIRELRDDLEAHDEYSIVSELLTRLRRRGTSAVRQRKSFADTSSLQEVTRSAIEATVPPNIDL